MEGQMKTVITALALVAGLAACNTRGGEDTARVGEGSDTSITTRQTQDTTIVSSDTTVKVETDTTVKEGDVKRDTRDTAKH
jgi:predicted small secreted protein